MATSIRLEPDIEKRLDFLASSTGRTKAYYLRELIEKGLDDLEDIYLADQVVEKILKQEEEIYSDAEVREELGLDDWFTGKNP